MCTIQISVLHESNDANKINIEISDTETLKKKTIAKNENMEHKKY